MILETYYKEEFLDRLREEPDETFAGAAVTKQDILNDSDAIDHLWCLYQKSVQEYDVDPDYAYGDAMYEKYGIKVKGWCS